MPLANNRSHEKHKIKFTVAASQRFIMTPSPVINVQVKNNTSQLVFDESHECYGENIAFFSRWLNTECDENTTSVTFKGAFLQSLQHSEVDLVMQKLAATFPSLEQLHVLKGRISLSSIAVLAQQAPIRFFTLKDCALYGGTESINDFQNSLTGHAYLEQFSFSNFDSMDEHGKAVRTCVDPILQALSSCPSLKVLRLEASQRELPTFAGNELAALFSHCDLEEFHLSHFILEKMHIRFLAWGVRTINDLKKLALKNCHLDDEAIIKLAPYLGSCQRLEELNITGNRIGNAGCAALVEGLESNHSVRSLSLLSNEEIGKAGYDCLKDLVWKSDCLSQLDIPYTARSEAIHSKLRMNSKKKQTSAHAA